MAPWTHTFISPQSERRLCCASREKSQFVQQYIDQPGQSGSSYNPVTLEEWWNGEFLRSVRKRMLAGETLPECEVCNERVLNLNTYRSYFTRTLFPGYIKKAFETTDDDGRTSMQPISFDYRLSNACNFKCRMCGEQLSSSWEIEKRNHGEWDPQRDPWMVPEMKAKIGNFQKNVAEAEFAAAINAGTIEEIYWVGGEPLVWEEHWKYMRQLVEEGNSQNVFVRYNTNLSRIEWKGQHLFDDVLTNFKGYNVCASIDAAGKVGEFVRTGLDWERWLQNFKAGLKYVPLRGEDSLVMDVTLTLPGLFGMKELFDLALELDVKMYVKIVYAFDASIVNSPFALPRPLLAELLDDLIDHVRPRVNRKTKVLLDTLEEMKQRPTFEEQWPGEFKEGFRRGRDFQQRLGLWRKDGESGRLRIEDIYQMRPGVLEWWTRKL